MSISVVGYRLIESTMPDDGVLEVSFTAGLKSVYHRGESLKPPVSVTNL